MTASLLVVGFTFLVVFGAVIAATYLLGTEDRNRKREIERRLKGLRMAERRNPENESVSLLREELEGSLPIVDRIVRDLDAFRTLQNLLTQSRIEWTPIDLLLRCAALGVLGAIFAYWRTSFWLFAVGFGALAAFCPIAYVMHHRSRRLQHFERQLPQALDLIVRALRAGHGLIAGIEMVAKELPDPIGGELEITFDEQNYGLDLRDALTNLSERVPVQDVHIVVTAILIQRETGGNLAEVLENTATVIRERYRLKRQIRVHTAQGRLTGWVLALLPVFYGVALFLVKPDFISVLWKDDRGVRMLYGAAVLTTVGALLIRKIIRIRV